jgi:hypothetical protein
MKYDVTKTIPNKVQGTNQRVNVEFHAKWKLTNMMKKVDADVNFYSTRPLFHELFNFIDGKRTISEIAAAAGYEYGVKINSEHVLLLFKILEEKGLLTLS